MKPPLLLATLSTALAFSACDAAVDFAPEGQHADETIEFSAPPVAGNYGFIVRGVFRLCETVGGNRSNQDDCRDMDRRSYFLTMHGLAKLTQEGDSVDGSYALCDMALTNVNGKVHADKDYLNSPISTYDTLASFTAQLQPSEQGPVLQSDMFALPLGVRFDNPVSDSMPTHRNSSNALDQDQDGKPGISLGDWGNYIDLGVRWISDMQLNVASNGRLEGAITKYDMNTVVYGTRGFAISSELIDLFQRFKVINEAELYDWAVDEAYRVELVPSVTTCSKTRRVLPGDKWWEQEKHRKWIDPE